MIGKTIEKTSQAKTRQTRVLIVIPAYNEAKSLPALVRALNAEVPGCDVVVIDDGSRDNTREVMKGLTRVVTLPCNLGIGGAVQTGWQVALREDYDFAMQVDGDGQHPAHEILKLLKAMSESLEAGEGVDLVVGSRFRGNGSFRSTAARRMGIQFFALMLSAICGTRITDPTSGFRVLSRRAIRLMAERYAEDFPEVEALVVAHRAGLRIVEVPVTMKERRAGRSSIGTIKSLIYMLKVPLAIFMTLLRKPEVNF